MPTVQTLVDEGDAATLTWVAALPSILGAVLTLTVLGYLAKCFCNSRRSDSPEQETRLTLALWLAASIIFYCTVGLPIVLFIAFWAIMGLVLAIFALFACAESGGECKDPCCEPSPGSYYWWYTPYGYTSQPLCSTHAIVSSFPWNLFVRLWWYGTGGQPLVPQKWGSLEKITTAPQQWASFDGSTTPRQKQWARFDGSTVHEKSLSI